MNVLYILGTFPAISETFILNEILEVIRNGLNVNIISISDARESIYHDEFELIRDRVAYLGQVPFRSKLVAVMHFFCTKPVKLCLTALSCYREDHWIKGAVERLLNSCYLGMYLKQLGIDHIHAHFANEPTSYAMWCGLLTGVPYTFTTHRHDIFVDPPGNYLEKTVRSKAMVTISDFNRQYLTNELRLPSNKIKLNRCGVDVSYFSPLKKTRSKTPALVTVARLHPIKGLDCLIKAYNILSREGLSFQAYIIGDGEDRRKLENLIDRYQLSNSVVLLGAKTRSEVRNFLRKGTVFVLPSYSEGLPTVIMEAFACGLPVIASNITGIPEIVQEDRSGYLVPPGDVSLLAEKIKALLIKPNKRKVFGCVGREFVEKNFSLKIQVRKLTSLWMQ